MTLCQYLTVSEKIITNFTVNYISCVDEKLFKIFNLLHGALDGQRAGSMHFPSNLALLLFVLKSKIWSLWWPLFTMMNDSRCFCRRFKSFLFNALWRHICSRLIRVTEECTFYWYIHCKNNCSLIYSGSELFACPSYAFSRAPFTLCLKKHLRHFRQ